MTKPIDPVLKELASELVYDYARARQAEAGKDLTYADLLYTSVEAAVRSLVIVARGGADAPGEQMDRAAAMGELFHALDGEWNSGGCGPDVLEKALLDRLAVVAGLNEPAPTNEEILIEETLREARDREIRLEIAKEIIPKFGTAACRWLTGLTEMTRFAGEQRADLLATLLVMHLLTDAHIDPMRIAQDVRNDAKASGTMLSGQMISKRIFSVIA